MSTPSTNANPTLLIQDDDHIAGPDSAAVTVVAYCDFECPYCGRAYPLIKQLQARLKDRLRVVFRHFPLIHKHPLAQQTAEAAESADVQGQFWAMHDLLFENQEALEKDDLYVYAASLDLDVGRFERELVDRDIRSGQQSGVTGTPTFFMNGVRHTDEETLERRLKRSIGTPTLDYLDPFLLFDDFTSSHRADYEAGFPLHPHRGIDTVTYVLEGEVRHKDTLGNAGSITAGEIQWMTTGRGIMHEEMPQVRPGGIAG